MTARAAALAKAGVPALAGVLAVYAALGTLYALRTPLWQVPDEPAHYNYVAQVSDASIDPPEIESGDYPFDYLEALKAERFPAGRSVAGIEYEDHQPPAYYYLASLAFRLGGDDPPGRARAVRLLGVLLGAVTVCLAWRTVRAGWPDDPALALATAAFVAFLPMHLTMTAAVNNDPLADLVMAAILWLAVVRVQGRVPGRAYVAAGGALFGLALWTKVTIYAPAAVALAAAGVMSAGTGTGSAGAGPDRARDPGRVRHAVTAALAPLAVGTLIALPWFARNIVRYGALDPLGLRAHEAVVVGQPRTAAWIATHGLDDLLRRMIVFTFDSFWGVFGWMGVFLDTRIYLGLAAVSVVAGVGLAGHLLRLRRAGEGARARKAALSVLGLTLASTMAGFLFYNLSFVQHQGRYLFPALIPIAVLFLLGLRQAVRWCVTLLPGQTRLASHLEAVAILGFGAGLAALALLSLQRYIVPGLG